MSKKNDILADSDITKFLGVPRSTLQDYKNCEPENWRFKVYNFLKSHSYTKLEDFALALSQKEDLKKENL